MGAVQVLAVRWIWAPPASKQRAFRDLRYASIIPLLSLILPASIAGFASVIGARRVEDRVSADADQMATLSSEP